MNTLYPEYQSPTPQRKSNPITHFIDTIRHLPLEEKLIGAGSIIALIGCFMPWARFPGVDNVGAVSFSGIQGVTYFVGYSIVAVSLVSLVFFLGKLVKLKSLEKYSEVRTKIFFAASLITSYLSIVGYTTYSSFYQVKYSASYIEFGVTMSFIGGLVMLVGSYFLHLSSKSTKSKTVVHHMVDVEDEATKVLENHGEERFHGGLEDLSPHVPLEDVRAYDSSLEQNTPYVSDQQAHDSQYTQ